MVSLSSPTDLRSLLQLLPEPLRCEALSHPHWASDHLQSFERLEFLGDAVLSQIVAAELFARYPDCGEGELTMMRAGIVSRDMCAMVAEACGLAAAMVANAPKRFASGAVELAGGRNVHAALTESVIGAGWLSLGPDATRTAVLGSFAAALVDAPARMRSANSKGELQEEVARRGGSHVHYEVSQDGPVHRPAFLARVTQDGITLGEGMGRTKRAAEQVAAQMALCNMTEQEEEDEEVEEEAEEED
jgi:ribonuclease-3